MIESVRYGLKPWLEVKYRGITVHYKKKLNGGGLTFGQEYVSFLRRRGMSRRKRIFEWCAGPGFIGFSLLAHRLCNTLCLADINMRAIRACRKTIEANGLHDRVSLYHSNNLHAIPEKEQWDLVVGNPPHFIDDHHGNLRAFDKDWQIHEKFYEQVSDHLAPGGVILIQENNRGSSLYDFKKMIESNGLSVVYHSEHDLNRSKHDRFYFIASMRDGDPAPDWLSSDRRFASRGDCLPAS